MHNLGQTRSSQQSNHLLLTADTFVRTTLPGMRSCSAIVHAGPAMGAKFTQYTAEFEAGGELGSTPAQRFVFVIEGASIVDAVGKRNELAARATPFCRKVCPIVSWPRKRAVWLSLKSLTRRWPQSIRRI